MTDILLFIITSQMNRKTLSICLQEKSNKLVRNTNIYILLKEREIKINDSQGRAYEPDFLLFAKQKK